MRAFRIAAWSVVVVLAALWLWQYEPIDRPASGNQSRPVFVSDATLPDLEDRPRSVSEWAGRPLILNFWATWCPPCRREIPLLRDLQEREGETGLQVIGIALDNLEDVRRFLGVIPVNYPMLYGEHAGSVFAERLAEAADDAFAGLPYSAVIAPDGELLMVHAGELEAEELDGIAAELAALMSGQRTKSEVRSRLAGD